MFVLMFVALLMQPLIILLPLGLVFALPMVSTFMRRYVGLLPTYVMLLSMAAAFYLLISTPAMVVFLLVAVPSSFAAMHADKHLLKFSASVGLVCSAFFLGAILGLLVLYRDAGGDFIPGIVESVIRSSSHADYTLPDFVYRLLTPGIVASEGGVNDTVRLLATDSLRGLATEFLRVEIPARLISGSLWGGVLAVYLPRLLDRRTGSRRGEFPDIYTWFLPSALRFGLLALFLLGVLAFILRIDTHMTIYFSLFEMIQTAYAFEGLGLLCWYMREKKMPRPAKVAIALLLFFLLRFVLFIIGIIDQFINPRHLNMHKLTNESEEEEE